MKRPLGDSVCQVLGGGIGRERCPCESQSLEGSGTSVGDLVQRAQKS